MTVRISGVVLAVVIGVGPACASFRGLSDEPLNEGEILLYRDSANKCRTHTTPYFKVKKSRDDQVVWKIKDPTRCAVSLDVEVIFDKKDADPLPLCAKKNRRKIQCGFREAPLGAREYSVHFAGEKEDPVLQIDF